MKACCFAIGMLAAGLLNLGGQTAPEGTPAASWLPTGPASTHSGPEVTLAPLLKPFGGHFRALACDYEKSRLTAAHSFAWSSNQGSLRTPAGEWACDAEVKPVPSRADNIVDLQLRFRLKAGKAESVGVAAAFDFDRWSTNHYLLIPSVVYNANRNRVVNRQYATGFDPEDLYRRDMPLTTTELPQFSPVPGRGSKIELNTGNASTPAICFFDRQGRRGFILLAHQRTRFGNSGLIAEESPDGRHATLLLSAPGVRERRPAFCGFEPSSDHGADWQPGEEVTLAFRVYSFRARDLPAFLARFHEVRKAVTGPNHPRDITPFSASASLLAQRIDGRWFEKGPIGFYRCENADWLKFGWVGGLMNTFPMLALDDDLHRDRVQRTFDFAIPAGQGRSGYFYAVLNGDGKIQGSDGYNGKAEIVLTRQNADVLFWMIKQFRLLEAQGRPEAIRPAWKDAARKLADAFVLTWQKHGQWGNYLNVDTGDVAIFNSTSGALAPGALALAADYFEQPSWMQVAQESALFYYDRDVFRRGFTTGACSDILQNADSESCAGLMTALMALYETTGERAWLEKARVLADLASTWTVSYDYEFPPRSQLGRLGAHVAGAVWASTQNKHAAPGFCTSSGDPLFKLYRAGQGRRYAELIRDVVHAHAEVVERPDRPTNGAGPGAVMERIQLSDAEGEGSIGQLYNTSNGWCELNGLLMALELPGIYARSDRDELFVFDSVEARVLERGRPGVTLEIRNPTTLPAAVSAFVESASEARRPLGYTAFLKWPRVEVPPGATVRAVITADGKARLLP